MIRSWGSINNSPHPLRNFLIENNFFDKPLRGHYTINIGSKSGWPCSDFLIRYNTSIGANIGGSCASRAERRVVPTISSPRLPIAIG